MSIEDAYVLARELACCSGDVAVALRAYETERIPRTSRVQLASRNQANVLHRSNGSAELRTDWLYSYDATRLEGIAEQLPIGYPNDLSR